MYVSYIFIKRERERELNQAFFLLGFIYLSFLSGGLHCIDRELMNLISITLKYKYMHILDLKVCGKWTKLCAS